MSEDKPETVTNNPKSWIAWKREAERWKREAERLQKLLDDVNPFSKEDAAVMEAYKD